VWGFFLLFFFCFACLFVRCLLIFFSFFFFHIVFVFVRLYGSLVLY
jgi:hypothetical protein